MRPFRYGDDHFTAVIDPIEAALITKLVGHLGTILESTGDATPDAPRDAALLRLLPDAYPDDSVASAEFRRFTAPGLADRKVRNAAVVTRDLAEAAASVTASRLILDDQSVEAWVRSLTDVRLVLASRLGIVSDDSDRADDSDEERMLGDVFDWLGWVQGSLVEALEQQAAQRDTDRREGAP